MLLVVLFLFQMFESVFSLFVSIFGHLEFAFGHFLPLLNGSVLS